MKRRVWVVLSLVITCMIAAFALSQVYLVTKPKIEQQRVEALKSSLSEVLPAASSFSELEPGEVWTGHNPAGTLVGIVFKVAPQGYGGPVTTVVGLDTTGRVTGIGFGTDLKETPGLGMKVREAWFRDQFKDRTGEDIRLKRDGGDLDAISAATITSRAVTDGVRKGIEQYGHYLLSDSSSTPDSSDAKP